MGKPKSRVTGKVLLKVSKKGRKTCSFQKERTQLSLRIHSLWYFFFPHGEVHLIITCSHVCGNELNIALVAHYHSSIVLYLASLLRALAARQGSAHHPDPARR